MASVLLLPLLAGGTYLAVRQVSRRREIVRRAVELAISKLDSALAEVSMIGDGEPKSKWSAKLDGDTTVLTLTFTNPYPRAIKEAVCNGLTLGDKQLGKKANFPIRVQDLMPGASRVVILHDDDLCWISDDVPINRINVWWAVKKARLLGDPDHLHGLKKRKDRPQAQSPGLPGVEHKSWNSRLPRSRRCLGSHDTPRFRSSFQG